MGKIPQPALAECITATLCVAVGNSWGHTWAAQEYADTILSDLSRDQWKYYLDERLSTDQHFLPKLQDNTTFLRWKAIVSKYDLASLMAEDPKVKKILKASGSGSFTDVLNIVGGILTEPEE